MAVGTMNDGIDSLPPQERVRCQIPQIKPSKGRSIEYYAHMDYDERTPPTKREAKLMCMTKGVACPLLEQCLALGLALEAPVGVWGGRVLVDGQDYYNPKEETID